MAKPRIIFVSQEIAPYLPVSENATMGRELPRALQSRKYEVRTFMPNYGAVNERRNQLHEVIRLSGINIPIKDADHPLIIKVASMQPSRIQVYFIDNDDYFQKSDSDADNIGSNRQDNDERVIFFTRGTMETAKKLRWEPDFFNASGWMAALVPLYIKTVFNDGSDFKKTKIVYSVLNQEPTAPIDPEIFDKLVDEGVPEVAVDQLRKLPFDDKIMHRIAISHSDAVVFYTPEPDPELLAMAEQRGLPVIKLDPTADNGEAFDDFLKSL